MPKHSRHAAILLAITLACTSAEPDTELRPPLTNFQLIRLFAFVTENQTPPRNQITDLVAVCCPNTIWRHRSPPETKPACRELQRVIEQDPDARGAFSNWGPNCYREIPTASLLAALQRRVKDWEPLVTLLGVIDPSAEAQQIMFRELLKLEPPFDTHSVNSSRIADLIDTLSFGGEEELALLAPALRSENRTERQAAARLFQSAGFEVPLELPDVLPALTALEDDPAPETASTARSASNTVKRHAEALRFRPSYRDFLVGLLVVDQLSVSVLDRDGPSAHRVRQGRKLAAIRWLSRRLVFCSSHLATVTLEAYRADSDLSIAFLAERAIDLRTRRCGSRLHSLL